jgi:hypothetical protein
MQFALLLVCVWMEDLQPELTPELAVNGASESGTLAFTSSSHSLTLGSVGAAAAISADKNTPLPLRHQRQTMLQQAALEAC